MERFRTDTSLEIEVRKVECVEDFQSSERRFASGEADAIFLPKANVIKLHFKVG